MITLKAIITKTDGKLTEDDRIQIGTTFKSAAHWVNSTKVKEINFPQDEGRNLYLKLKSDNPQEIYHKLSALGYTLADSRLEIGGKNE